MNYKPLSNRVIIEPQEAEQKTKSGIVLPDSAQEKPQIGKVIKVGPGKMSDDGKLLPMSVKEGDLIVYPKYGGTEIKLDAKTYLIITESDILAVKE